MININTASIDDLLTLEGIGAQRAAAIIKLRGEKGYITMNDIEDNLHNTTSTIQKLLNDELISFETPPTLVDSIMERQDGEHKKAMDNVTKEFGLKLNQVHEHYRTMQRNYEEEMNRMTKKMGELEKKLSEKKSESLVTGEIVDKLAPHGIYGIKDDGQKSLKMEKNTLGAEASGGVASCASADSGLAKPDPTSSISQTKFGKITSTSVVNSGLKQYGPSSTHIEGPPPPP
jgi:predicted transcriptional regulator